MSDQARTKGPDEKFCESCGAVIKLLAEICPKCGVRQASVRSANVQSGAVSSKSKLVTFLLCTFGGWLGLHQFYAGKITTGVMQILFGWATLYIWPLIDWIQILSGNFKDIDGNRIVTW